MTTHRLEIRDGARSKDRPAPTVREMRRYRVITPIRKNGKILPVGTITELERTTGENFIAAGNVEEA